MASIIKVDQIEGQSGTTVTLPSGQTLDLSSGSVTLPNTSVSNAQLAGSIDLTTKVTGALPTGNLPTIPVTKGGTGLTSLGTANQVVAVNSGASALEFQDASSGKVLGQAVTESTARTTWSSPGELGPFSGNMSDFHYPNSSNCYVDCAYTKQSATSRIFITGHIVMKGSTNTHDFAVFIVGDEANGRVLHLDEHNGARNYLAHSFTVCFSGLSTGAKTFRATAGTGASRSHSGTRGSGGDTTSHSDVSTNNGYTLLSVMEVEV